MVTSGAAPARLGRYELLARLATGGMGEIFLARLEGAAGFEKLYVIKRILPHMADDARFRAMLIAEARVASIMTHANICQVYELGETDGQLYIAMEYLEGITLLPLLRKLSKDRGALELGLVAGVIQQVTDALHYAHELRDRSGATLGIVHRDVTPTNLFLTDSGVVKVLDFGIAKVKDISAHTQTGTVKGKYAYMAPEQLRGTAIDRRADVFALGVVAYEMLALRRLFQRKTDYLTFRAVMEQPISDIRRYRPNCPDPLAAAILRALERDPADRFDTARQFGSAVLDAIAGLTRPWTQGEISDFIRANFADDIARRSAQITRAVRAGTDHDTMPLISPPDDETTDVDDAADDEFPAVSSEVSETPVDVRHLREPSGEAAALDEPAGRPPGFDLQRAVPQPSPPIVVVNHKRSLVWPLVAFAMLAIAGTALFLVWQQMQNQPPSLVITNDRGSRVTEGGSNVIVVGPSVPDRVDMAAEDPEPTTDPARDPVTIPGAVPGAIPGAAGSAAPPGPPRRNPQHRDPYRDAVRARHGDVTRCATTHGAPPPGTQVKIVVGPDGHPRSVAIEPGNVAATPLGSCIQGVFAAASFPRGEPDHRLVVNLH